MSRATAGMFDDTSVYACLSKEVLPTLRTWPSARLWQLGLIVPEDPWALAILAFEAGVLARSTLFATDPDAACVLRSRAMAPERASLEAVAERYCESGGTSSLAEYFLDSGDGTRARESLRKRISFFQYDSRSDAPHNEFQLIAWRAPVDPAADGHTARVVRASTCRHGVVAFVGRDPAEVIERDPAFRRLAPRVFRRER